jgi:glycosyltransferase involved in cell wall biosynthesis
MSVKSYAVVIPAYNEAGTIRNVVERALEQGLPVIVVDDGSTDGTSDQLADLDIALLRNEPNAGKAASLWRGMQTAQDLFVDGVITLDGDGQHRPEDIPRIIEASESNPGNIVIGSRLHDREAIPAKRYYANRFANFWIAWASGMPLEDSQSGFRLYPAELLQALSIAISRKNSFVFESEIIIEAGWRGIGVFNVDIPAIYGAALRPSHFQSVTDILRITRMVAGRLWSRGMYLPGLYRSTIKPAISGLGLRGWDADGMFTLLLSLLVGLVTLGVSHLWLFIQVIRTGAVSKTVSVSGGAVAVLGKQLKQGELSADYRLRLDRALSLYRTQKKPDILVIGGSTTDEISEASAGARYLIAAGVQPTAIVLEELSVDTLQNFRHARPWFDTHPQAVVVSNRYHLLRIVTMARGLGLDITSCAAEENCRPWRRLPRLLLEAVYLHWYWSGRIFARLTGNKRMLGKIA